MPADDLIRSCVTVTAPGKRRKCRVPMVSMHGAYRRPCRRCLSDIDSMSPAYRGPDLYSGRGKTDAHARLSLRIQGSRSAEMSLRDKLDERWRRMRERSPEVGQAYDALVQTLVASGLTETSLKAGERMPDFALPNVEGRFVASRALLERGPLVVSFFRGGWCPVCTTELTALQPTVPGIEAPSAPWCRTGTSRPRRRDRKSTRP